MGGGEHCSQRGWFAPCLGWWPPLPPPAKARRGAPEREVAGWGSQVLGVVEPGGNKAKSACTLQGCVGAVGPFGSVGASAMHSRLAMVAPAGHQSVP